MFLPLPLPLPLHLPLFFSSLATVLRTPWPLSAGAGTGAGTRLLQASEVQSQARDLVMQALKSIGEEGPESIGLPGGPGCRRPWQFLGNGHTEVFLP